MALKRYVNWVVVLVLISLTSYHFSHIVNKYVIKEKRTLRFFNSSKVFNESYTPYLIELGLLRERDDFVDLSQPLPPVTFITAFSENHAAEGRSLIGRLAKDHPDWKVYVYDIGMTKNSRTFFKKALQEFPVVFWMDTSTFFAANMTMKEFVDRINITDSEGPHVYMVKGIGHGTFAVTTPGLCMAPKGHKRRGCKFGVDLTHTYANCHRYDQSAINLILGRYQKSFLGPWAVNYIWTQRDIRTNETRISCSKMLK